MLISGHRPKIFLKDFLQDLPMVCFVVTQHSESELSLCLRYSKTSCRQATTKNNPMIVTFVLTGRTRVHCTMSQGVTLG